MSSDSRVFVVDMTDRSPHPNADNLEIINIFGGYPYVGNKNDWKGVTKAAYIPVDMIVPNEPEYAFLRPGKPLREKDRRITARRFRGIFSMGLCMPVPDEWEVGMDITDVMRVTKYEPDEGETVPHRPGVKVDSGETEQDPGLLPFKYDIESLRRYKKVFQEGEEVIISEKIHGSYSAYLYSQDRLWIKSRAQFKRPEIPGLWSDIADKYRFDRILQSFPDVALFGEVYGQTDLRYGMDHTDFIAFDAYHVRDKFYFDYDNFVSLIRTLNEAFIEACNGTANPDIDHIRIAPVLYRGPWISYEHAASFAEGNTTVKNPCSCNPGEHVREGFVIRSAKERQTHRLGRTMLKLVGEGYLTRP